MRKKYWDYTVAPGERKVVAGLFFDADHHPVTIRITGEEEPEAVRPVEFASGTDATVAADGMAPGTTATK